MDVSVFAEALIAGLLFPQKDYLFTVNDFTPQENGKRS
jgi:hypothetical protein